MARITYTPGEGDPHTTRCHGITFKAHVPTEVPDGKMTTQIVTKRTTTADGRSVLVTNETEQINLWKLLVGNPQFYVDGQANAKAVKPSPRIESAEDYEAFARSWIDAQTDVKVMDQRWDDEEAMREELSIPENMLNRLSDALVMRAAKLRYLERKRQTPAMQAKGQQQVTSNQQMK